MEIGHALPKSSDNIAMEVWWRKWCNVLVLVASNLINYADRYTLAGVLSEVQAHFRIDNESAGLIQTVCETAYTLAAPLCGCLGDRYDRKVLLVSGMAVWNAAAVAASFVDVFWALLLLRAVFGVGQACFVTVAPTVVGDLFVGDDRSKVLVAFYLAVPVGGGLGYSIGAHMAHRFGSWRWSLRATPALALILVILTAVVLREPYRNQSKDREPHMPPFPCCGDLSYLLRNRSYVFSTLAYTCVAFCSGAINWWTPKLMTMGLTIQNSTMADPHRVVVVYGAVSTSAGILGLTLGYLFTFKYKEDFPEIDPAVSAVGLATSAPLLVASTYLSLFTTQATFVVFFFGLVALNLNWAIVCDILLCVVVPSKRALAMGLQLMLGRSLGDASSPYVVGAVADAVSERFGRTSPDAYGNEFGGLQMALFVAYGVEVVGMVFFVLTAVYVRGDEVVERRMS